MPPVANKTKVPIFLYDRWLLIAVFALVALGLLMVASASMVVSDREYGYPFHFLIRQSIYIGLGLMLAILVIRIPLAIWQRYNGYLLVLGIGLLILVLVPHIGREVNGSRRWISLGVMTVQVSELVKLCVIIYLASYMVRHEKALRQHVIGFAKPMVLLGFIGILLLLEPDFGATAVIMATALGMMFLGGVRLWQYVLLMVLVAAAMGLLAVSSPYRVERLTAFLHPWANQFSSGYQLTQSLIAFGRGGIFGVGLGNSIQKLFYLPEAHTDFLFAVLAEELGLIGGIVVVVSYAVLVARAMIIGRTAHKAQQLFAAYTAYGFAMWIGLQAMINIGVNAGLLPTKGLTLPFMSYGGSSMLVNCVVVAMLLRIGHEARVNTAQMPAARYHARRRRTT